MCKEDLALGRSMKGGQATSTVGTASAKAVGPSNLRTSLILCPPLAGTLTYVLGPTAVAGRGIVLVAGGSPFRMVLKDHGSMVTELWSVVGDAADRVVNVFYAELPMGVELPRV